MASIQHGPFLSLIYRGIEKDTLPKAQWTGPRIVDRVTSIKSQHQCMRQLASDKGRQCWDLVLIKMKCSFWNIGMQTKRGKRLKFLRVEKVSKDPVSLMQQRPCP